MSTYQNEYTLYLAGVYNTLESRQQLALSCLLYILTFKFLLYTIGHWSFWPVLIS
jgi:hypothetical protein